MLGTEEGRRVREQGQGLTEFGRELWALAAKRGITAWRALARRMGISHETLRNYTHGRSPMPPRTLKAFSRAMGLTEAEKKALAWVYAWGETTTEEGGPEKAA